MTFNFGSQEKINFSSFVRMSSKWDYNGIISYQDLKLGKPLKQQDEVLRCSDKYDFVGMLADE